MITLAPRVRPVSRTEYDRMVELGLIGPDERVELINGVIVQKMPQKPPHSGVTSYLGDLVRDYYGSGTSVRIQMPFALSERSEPEPDVLVVRGGQLDYLSRHPTPEDVVLAVEVADSTVLPDRRDKVPMYMAEGVAEAWLLEIPNRRLLRFTQDDPVVPQIFAEGDALPIGGVTVGDLLP